MKEVIPTGGASATSSANVTRVEFWTTDKTTDVDVYIYDSFAGGTLSGLLASKLNNSFNESGYHSVALDSPLAVTAGDDVIAVVKFTNDSYLLPIPYDSQGPTETQRTYISSNGSSWIESPYGDVGIRLRTGAPSCQKVTGATISGATVGLIDQPHTFTTTVSPSNATTPITYSWSPSPGSGQGTNQATYTWAVTGSQTINSFLPMRNDLWLTSCALYVIELVDQFTVAQIEDYSLFQLLLGTMHQLCQADNNEMVMRYFELHLLNEVGYRPQLQHCVSCQAALEPASSTFSSSAGGMLCSSCRQSHPLSHPLSINTLEVLRSLQGSDYSTVSRLRVNQEISHELEAVMRGYLRFLLERDVKSATWLDTMRM